MKRGYPSDVTDDEWAFVALMMGVVALWLWLEREHRLDMVEACAAADLACHPERVRVPTTSQRDDVTAEGCG